MTVEHDSAHHRFIVRLPEGSAWLHYRIRPDGVMDFTHSETDPPLQHHGLAAELAKAAFAYARTNGIKVRASCPYVTAWLEKHPEERDIVAP